MQVGHARSRSLWKCCDVVDNLTLMGPGVLWEYFVARKDGEVTTTILLDPPSGLQLHLTVALSCASVIFQLLPRTRVWQFWRQVPLLSEVIHLEGAKRSSTRRNAMSRSTSAPLGSQSAFETGVANLLATSQCAKKAPSSATLLLESSRKGKASSRPTMCRTNQPRHRCPWLFSFTLSCLLIPEVGESGSRYTAFTIGFHSFSSPYNQSVWAMRIPLAGKWGTRRLTTGVQSRSNAPLFEAQVRWRAGMDGSGPIRCTTYFI